MTPRIPPKIKKGAALVALAAGTLMASVPQAHAAAGALDPTFSGDGIQLLPAARGPVGFLAQPDGKVVWVTEGKFSAIRQNADGALDRSFGGDGVAGVRVDGAQAEVFGALQPDGKIVLVGGIGPNGSSTVAVARLNPNGSPDPTFDPGGPDGDGKKVYTDPNITTVDGFVVQPDGKITIVGNTFSGWHVTRLSATGVVDNTQWEFANFPGGVQPAATALTPDGKLVVAGSATQSGDADFAVARYTLDGKLDKTFNTTGMATVGSDDLSEVTTAVKVQPDRSIIVAGNGDDSETATVVRRITEDGKLDTSFGQGGAAIPDFTGDDAPAGLALQGDGKVLVAAQMAPGLGYGAARLDSGGALDPSFGDGGRVEVEFESIALPTAAGLDSAGRFVIGGVTVVKGVSTQALAIRLQADPPPVTDTGGQAQPGTGGASDGPATQQPDTQQPDTRNDQPPPRPRCAGKVATIVGTPGKDRLRGTARADVIVALGGNDVVTGLKGNDVVCGGAGNDVLSGGPGRDVLRGEAGNDKLIGGPGRDQIRQ